MFYVLILLFILLHFISCTLYILLLRVDNISYSLNIRVYLVN